MLTILRALPRRPLTRSLASLASSIASAAPPKPAPYGQPLPSTHPHMLRPGELTLGLSALEYELRRAQLMSGLDDGSVVVCVGGRVRMMSQEIFYSFRQSTDFLYLTGFQEPDSAVVLQKDSSPRGFKMTLFVREKDPDVEQWDGARTGTLAAVEHFMADEALPTHHLPSYLRSVLPNARQVYSSHKPGRQTSTRRTTKSILEYLAPNRSDADAVASALSSPGVRALGPLVQKLRARKSSAEARLMREAGRVGGEAMGKTMRFTEPGRTEAQLAAHFEYACAMQGSERQAYVPVVASGANALAVHYTFNNCRLNPGELVLMDAGCELHGYTSDITRTWPVSGTFSPAQRDLYQAVLNVEKACIKMCTADRRTTLNEIHRASVALLGEELRQLGFETRHGELEKILYPHYIGHPLGMDLHDTPMFDRSTRLEPGHVITIEPGLYVPTDSRFPKHFHGLGVRIEDDVLVGEDEPTVLTTEAPKEIVDVEGACLGLLEAETERAGKGKGKGSEGRT